MAVWEKRRETTHLYTNLIFFLPRAGVGGGDGRGRLGMDACTH